MNKKLVGTLFVYNGNKYDYCFKEAIQCLLEFCDQVIVAAGGDDGTLKDVHSLSRPKLDVIEISQKEWDSQHGKEKLNYFSNVTIEFAERMGYEYQFNLQADEIVHEKSYESIQKAINSGLGESYMCSRINLWESPYLQLNVEHARMPCSKEIIRLAKTQYRSCGDAESIDAQCVMNFVKEIEIWHYGFIRKKEIMKSKIINMQESVFEMGHDKKLDGSDIFDSTLWFSGDDLKVIDYPHPKIMKEWILTRP